MKPKFTTMLAALMLVFLLRGTAAMGQATTTTGAIVGNVTDSSGAVVAGATVTLRSETRRTSVSMQTNAEGQYSFPSVPPGNYTLSAIAPNFQTAIISGIAVQVAKSTMSNFVLQVGTVSQSVSVTATAETQLQTTDAAVSNVIGSKEVRRTPDCYSSGIRIVVAPARRAALDRRSLQRIERHHCGRGGRSKHLHSRRSRHFRCTGRRRMLREYRGGHAHPR